MLDRVCVGVITKPVGVNGQVKVRSYTSTPSSILGFNQFILADSSSVHFKHLKQVSQGEFVGFIDNINTRTGAERYRLKELYIHRSDLPILTDNEYYYDDIVGLVVLDNNNQVLGKVKAVLDYGAGTFLEISMNNNKIGTISFNNTTIPNVNIENKYIVIDTTYLLI